MAQVASLWFPIMTSLFLSSSMKLRIRCFGNVWLVVAVRGVSWMTVAGPLPWAPLVEVSSIPSRD